MLPLRQCACVLPNEMDNLDSLHRRMRIANLEGQRVRCEIERDALTRQIESPLASEQERQQAAQLRDALWDEWVQIDEELRALLDSGRQAQP